MTSDLLVDLKNLLAKPIDAVINYETSVFGGLLEKSQGQVVLFGSGNLGRKCLKGLRKIGIEPVAFADNNAAIWNTKLEGVEVLSPEIAALNYGQNALFLITVFNRENSLNLIQEQLHQLGCQNVALCAVFFWCHPQEFLPHFYLDLPHKIYEQAGDVIAAFDLWQDTESKREYLKQIKWRILLESDGLFSSQEIQYFPTFLRPLLKKEVFVDCGTFDGDTLKTFIDLQGDSIEKIICFETYRKLNSDLQNFLLPVNELTKTNLDNLIKDSKSLLNCLEKSSGICQIKISQQATMDDNDEFMINHG